MAVAEQGIRMPVVALWRTIRHLYPVYATIAECCELSRPPYASLSDVVMDNADCVLQIANWIKQIDAKTEAHHLRSILQELGVGSSDLCLQMWLKHFLSKPEKTGADRDKIDFLITHYLRLNLPPSMQEGTVSRAAIAAVLEPILGADCDQASPESNELNELIGMAEHCRTLADMERSRLIVRGRELKVKAGARYGTSSALLAFTHFNAVVRRECQRLMNSDLKFIGEALDRLEKQGVEYVDCRAANWSEREPVAELKTKWATWELQNTDYSTDFFASLIGFRTAMEEALSHAVALSMGFLAQELRAIRDQLAEMQAELNDLPARLASIAGEDIPSDVAKPSAPQPSSPTTPPVSAKTKQFCMSPEVTAVVADIMAGRLDALMQTQTAPAAAVPAIVEAQNAVQSSAVSSEPAMEPAPVTPAEQAALAAEASLLTPLQEGARNAEPTSPEPVPPAPAPSAPDLTEGVARLQKLLAGKRPTAVSIAVAGTRVLLTGAEVAMLSDKENATARTVQRAVVTRMFLVSALETYSKNRDKAKLVPIAAMARAEQESVRAVIATCKANKLAREEEIVSATGKQLSAMLERAEHILR